MSFLLVNGLKKWGAYHEMIGLVGIKWVYMLTGGIIRQTFPSHFWILELQTNLYRALLMMLNCFFFIWFFDEMKNSCEMDLHMDIRKASKWDKRLTSCFVSFLRQKKMKPLLKFFRNQIEDNSQVWVILQNPSGFSNKPMQTQKTKSKK